MDETTLLEKTHACLAGAALGDAMGAPTESWHYRAVMEKWGRITGLVPDHKLYSGQEASTDDTQHRLILFKTIIDKGGRIDAYDLAEGILEHMNLGMMAGTEIEIYKKLASGMLPHRNGLGNFQTPTCCFASLPIGILHACDPYSAAKDAYELFSVWVDSIAQEAPMAVAAAVAEAFKPVATRDSIVEAAKAYCGPRVRKHLDRSIEVAARFDDPWEAVPAFYEELLVQDGLDRYIEQRARFGPLWGQRLEDATTSGSPLEMAGLGLAFFYIGNGDAMGAMGGAATFGRDCDGFAGIAGAITGAWKGTGVFDMEMVSQVDAADKAYYGEQYPTILELAEEMQAPILNTLKEKQAVVGNLEGLL
jgi:ADP-ribosylglycohydrolase